MKLFIDSGNVRLILNAKLMNRYENKNSYVEFKDGLRVQFLILREKKEFKR